MRIFLLIFVAGFILRNFAAAEFRLTTFSADVTVPIGHGMMGGSWKSTKVADSLFAHGIVLMKANDPGGFRPVVYVAVDWCENPKRRAGALEGPPRRGGEHDAGAGNG